MPRTIECDECGSSVIVHSQRISKDHQWLNVVRHKKRCSLRTDVRWTELVRLTVLPEDIPGYWVSDDGRVMGRRGKEVKLNLLDNYVRAIIHIGNGIEYALRVNRIVCEAFNGPPPSPLHQAAHLDCDRLNNNYWNLEWQTGAENMAHPITRQRGMSPWVPIRAAANAGDRALAVKLLDEYMAARQ